MFEGQKKKVKTKETNKTLLNIMFEENHIRGKSDAKSLNFGATVTMAECVPVPPMHNGGTFHLIGSSLKRHQCSSIS